MIMSKICCPFPLFIFLCAFLSTSIFVNAGFSNPAPTQNKLQESKAQPRSGLLQNVLNFALESPLWKTVLVPQARANIVQTAESNGIRWNDALEWISNQFDDTLVLHNDSDYPSYYTKPFHAYEQGNLCWNAGNKIRKLIFDIFLCNRFIFFVAFEQELASRAVGARNFPAFGEKGEDAFRGAFEEALNSLGARCPNGGTIIDLGCGTGIGTRRLAYRFTECNEIIGIDFSPYFIEVGNKLLDLAPKCIEEGGPWVTTINSDSRISLRVGDASNTGMRDGCADVVNVGLVVHELPLEAACSICDEAFRLLKPGGQLWLYEMDFDSPGFSKQRSNPLLFSLIRSTEPWLDVYADNCDDLREHIYSKFSTVSLTAATGRHYALVATKDKGESIEKKSIVDDKRFNSDGTYSKGDTHLKTWESATKDKSD